MKTKLILILLLYFSFFVSPSHAFWVWTPETNKWVNPKYAVKDTPQEQLAYALDYYKNREYGRAIQEFNKLIHHYPKARQAPEAQYYIGLCLEDQNKLFEAFKAYQTVIDKYPFSERSAEIIQKQYDIGEELLEGHLQESGFVTAVIGTDYNVIEVFRAVIKNAPYGKLAPLAQYKIGLYLQEKQLYQEARDEFEKLVNDYPESEWAKAAQYQIALSDAKRSTEAQYDQAVTQAAVKEFEEFVKTNPEADLSDKAKKHIQELNDKDAENNYLIAVFYEKQKNYKAAKIYHQIVVNQFGKTPWASKSLEHIQKLSFMEK